MKLDFPLISVIVPVYNVKPYLAKCLDSVLAQTYPNMEVIVVNDASTDGGGAVCGAFAAKDSRLRVLHLAVNSGLSAARNQGVQAASGQFAAFVDSNDYVEKGLLEKLYAHLVETGADISVCGAVGLKVKGGPAAVYTVEETVGCLARRSPFLWTACPLEPDVPLLKRKKRPASPEENPG